MEFTVSTEKELDTVVGALLPLLESKPLVLFRGDLGAGKTTLIKRICAKAGVESDMSSPSFGLVNEYSANGKPVYHIDLYRINDVEEIYEFGLPEILDSQALCFVEWPEMTEEIWPEYEHLTVRISMDKQMNRCIFVG